MKTKVSPTIVGAFVIGAVVLGIVALLAFGGFNFFAKPQRFLVYFDESVHGLDQGSQVKIRGVRVGRVVDLTVRYDDQRNRSVVAVLCEFSKDVISDNRGQPINVTDRQELQAMVQRGLRARLEVQALATGMLFVGLDFVDPKEHPPIVAVPDDRYVIVPFVPSAIAEFQASLTEILAGLKRIDFAGLSKQLAGLVADVRQRLDGVDLRGVTEQWKRTGAQVEALANGPEIKGAFQNLNVAVTELRATVAKLDGQIEPTGKDMRATLAEAQKAVKGFHGAAEAVRAFVAAQSGLGDDFSGTLQQLGEAAESVKRLADFLERNPSAILTGRKAPP
ncbi:MAG: MCE family protein [Opitutaceae bacterium]|nr:MCE family protein [Opitutaceae bacterium]